MIIKFLLITFEELEGVISYYLIEYWLSQLIGRAQELNTGQEGMEIETPNDEYCKHDPEEEDCNLEKSH